MEQKKGKKKLVDSFIFWAHKRIHLGKLFYNSSNYYFILAYWISLNFRFKKVTYLAFNVYSKHLFLSFFFVFLSESKGEKSSITFISFQEINGIKQFFSYSTHSNFTWTMYVSKLTLLLFRFITENDWKWKKKYHSL